MKRVVKLVAGLFVLWLIVLVVLGLALEGRTRDRVVTRLEESLHAEGAVASSDLALVRGTLVIDGLSLERDDLIGKLAIDVGSIQCDLPALGWALVDGDCRELAISNAKLEVSSVALFKLQRPKRSPFHADSIVIDNATLTFAPSAFVPQLGAITIAIEHADAASTVFTTPLSWIFALRSLRATLMLPGDIVIKVGYAQGKLTASGAVFGTKPIEIPFEIPVAELHDDPKAELEKLAKLGSETAKRLVEQRAEDWLKSKLSAP
ncbi:MAG: hypothetical protein AB7P03_16270 [Kofleriaceae bacterium]